MDTPRQVDRRTAGQVSRHHEGEARQGLEAGEAEQAIEAAKQMPRVWQEQGAKSNGHAVHDAIGWLRYAEESATRRLREGKLKRYDESHIFLMLALRALEGGGR